MIMSNHNPHHSHHHHTSHLHHPNIVQASIKSQPDSASSSNQSVDMISSSADTNNKLSINKSSMLSSTSSDSFVRVLKNSIGKATSTTSNTNTMSTLIQQQQQNIDKQPRKPTFQTESTVQPLDIENQTNGTSNTHINNSPSLDTIMNNQSSTVIPTKLYVTNFPFTCTQRQIQDLFNKFGQVVECTLKKDYYAYIQYTSTRDAQAAFKNANGIRMLGRKLTVHLATSKKSQSHINHSNTLTNLLSENSTPIAGQQTTNMNQTSAMLSSTINSTRIIHVRNFPESCSQSQIRDYFKVYGEIGECLILHDSYAFVHYKHAHEARVALQSTNNTFFLQNSLLVQYSRSKFKQQTQQTGGPVSSCHGQYEVEGKDQMSALADMVDDLAFGDSKHNNNINVNGSQKLCGSESKFYNSNAENNYKNNNNGMYQENSEGLNNFGDHLETSQDKHNQMVHDNENSSSSDTQFMWDNNNKHTNDDGTNCELNELHEIIPERPAVRTKLYVTNFPEDMDQDEMKQLFNNYGNVLECTIMWNQYAFVHFGSYEEAEKALMAIKGIQYKGCKISVQWSTSAKYQQPKQHASNITLTASNNSTGSSNIQKPFMNSSQSPLQHEFSKSSYQSSGESKLSVAPKKILERPAQLKPDPSMSLMSKQVNPVNAWGNTINNNKTQKPSPNDEYSSTGQTVAPTKLMSASNSWASIMNNSTPVLDSNGNTESKQSIHIKSNSTQSATSCSKSSSGQFKISFSEVVRSSSNTFANTLQTNPTPTSSSKALPKDMKSASQSPIREPVMVMSNTSQHKKLTSKNSKEASDLIHGSDSEHVVATGKSMSKEAKLMMGEAKSKPKRKKELGEEIIGNEPTKAIENTINEQDHNEHKTKTATDLTCTKIEPSSGSLTLQQQHVSHTQSVTDELTESQQQSIEPQYQTQKTSTQQAYATGIQYHQQQQQPLLEAPTTATINPMATNFIPNPTNHFMDGSLQNPAATSQQQYKYTNQYQQNSMQSMYSSQQQANGMDMYGQQQNRAISSTPSSTVQPQQQPAFTQKTQQSFEQPQQTGYAQQQQVAHTYCHPTQSAYFPQQQQQVYNQQYQRNAPSMSNGNMIYHQQQQQQQQQLVHPSAFSSNSHPHNMQAGMHSQLRNPQIMNQNVFGNMNGSQQQQQQLMVSQNGFMQHHHQFNQTQQPQSQVNSWIKAPGVIDNAGYNSIASTNQSHSLLNGHVQHMNSMYNSICQFQPITNNSSPQQSQLIASQIFQNNCLNHQQPQQQQQMQHQLNQHQFHSSQISTIPEPTSTTTTAATTEICDDLEATKTASIEAQSISPINALKSETNQINTDQIVDSLPFIGTSNFIKVSAPVDTLDTSNASSLSPSLDGKALAFDGISSKLPLSDISSEVSSESSSSSSSSSKSSSSFSTNKNILSSFNNFSNYVLFPSGMNFDFTTPASQQLSNGNPIQRQQASAGQQQQQQQQNNNPNYFPIEDVLANLIR